MKNFLLSLRFVIKRVFRLTAANIAWLICFAAVIVAVTVGMAVAPEGGIFTATTYIRPYKTAACHRCIRIFM